jgi:hypothetical protein
MLLDENIISFKQNTFPDKRFILDSIDAVISDTECILLDCSHGPEVLSSPTRLNCPRSQRIVLASGYWGSFPGSKAAGA